MSKKPVGHQTKDKSMTDSTLGQGLDQATSRSLVLNYMHNFM